jgi:signal peptidase II
LKKKSLIVLAIIFIVLVIDQIVKIWVKTDFSIGEARPMVPNIIQLYFIENRGMAFGTTLGDGIWAKYVLSLFRFAAIIGIAIYIKRLIIENEVKIPFLMTVALIFAGATGNLIDGMFYDFVFGVDPSISENWVLNDFNMPIYGADGNLVLRENGFLLGSVVDMLQFTLTWPEWVPFGYNGKEIFPFIFNVADASISLGFAIIVLRYRHFFKKEKSTNSVNDKKIEES